MNGLSAITRVAVTVTQDDVTAAYYNVASADVYWRILSKSKSPFDASRPLPVAPPPPLLLHLRLIRHCLIAQVAIGLGLAPLYSRLHLQVDLGSMVPYLIVASLLYTLGIYLLSQRDSNGQGVLALAMLLSLSMILLPAQYLAVRWNRPLIDPWLAAADAVVGANVGEWSHALRRFPAFLSFLSLTYYTLLPQLIMTPLVVYAFRRSGRLWMFVGHFHVCAVACVAALAMFPAAGAFQFYGVPSTLPQGSFIAEFNGLRDGTLNVINFQQLDGLISVPSFHVAGALIATWAVRGLWPYRWMVGLNIFLITASVLSGAHYLIDLPITFAVVAASVWIVRAHGRSDQARRLGRA
jgi:hypothetical protein